MKSLLPDVEYLRPGIVAFLAEVDELMEAPSVPILATALIYGKLTLLLGRAYMACENEEARGEMLSHECAHFLMAHIPRCGDRDQRAWNACTDASLHYVGAADWKFIEQELRKLKGHEQTTLITFDRLLDKDGNPMPPMPPEMAYDRLPKGGTVMVCNNPNCPEHGDQRSHGPIPPGSTIKECPHSKPGEGCGSTEHSKMDDSVDSLTKRTITGGKILEKDKDFINRLRGSTGGAGDGRGSRDVPDLKSPSPWIRDTLQWLIHTRARNTRRRSWRRENRSFPILPGKVRLKDLGGLFFIDASGSIGGELLSELISTVVNTPELKGSEVVIFDTHWTDPLPVTHPKVILDKSQEMGGGTHIKACLDAFIDDPRPRVILTDGYSNDGWPKRNGQPQIWVVWQDGPTSPYATATIRIK